MKPCSLQGCWRYRIIMSYNSGSQGALDFGGRSDASPASQDAGSSSNGWARSTTTNGAGIDQQPTSSGNRNWDYTERVLSCEETATALTMQIEDYVEDLQRMRKLLLTQLPNCDRGLATVSALRSKVSTGNMAASEVVEALQELQ